MSFARPPHFLGIDYSNAGQKIIESTKQEERWMPMGLIHTERPLSERDIKGAELTPTIYMER